MKLSLGFFFKEGGPTVHVELLEQSEIPMGYQRHCACRR